MPGANARVFVLKILPQFVQIQGDVIAGAILSQSDAVAIEDLPADRWDADSPKRLRLLVFGIVPERDHLHEPKSDEQDAHAGERRDCNQAQLRIALLQLIENEHVSRALALSRGRGGSSSHPESDT
jgi:hypothetical protein